jgi:hypothetical protein
MQLHSNESTIDRIVRVVIGAALAALALLGSVGTPVLYVVWVLAVILIGTGLVGFCPLYAIFRFSTKSTR